MTHTKRKICFVITNFIHYSRNLLILDELKARPDVELHIAVGSAAFLPKYMSKFGGIGGLLAESGFSDVHELYFNLEVSRGITEAKTFGLGTIEFSSLYDRIKPDVVVVLGDRFEVLAAAMAAAYMNIPVAHVEGGDVSGTLDESVRHAITKLAHIHFATNEPARRRIVQMGEDPKYVFNFGCPDIEVAQVMKTDAVTPLDFENTGSGAHVDVTKDFLIVMYHPVTTELATLADNSQIVLRAVHSLNMPAIWFWPNFDAGGEDIAQELRRFREEVHGHTIKFMRQLPPQHFLYLLKKASCLVGNSSAGIKECSFLGVPVVNIGTRQKDRLRAGNVLDVAHDEKAIYGAIQKQITRGKYEPSEIYYKPDTGKNIAHVLATTPLYTQKRFVTTV